jgi:hypothetical protein
LKEVLVGPSSQLNSEEYRYQSLSIVALNINSISSPTFVWLVEVSYFHLAGFSTWANEREVISKNKQLNIRTFFMDLKENAKVMIEW